MVHRTAYSASAYLAINAGKVRHLHWGLFSDNFGEFRFLKWVFKIRLKNVIAIISEIVSEAQNGRNLELTQNETSFQHTENSLVIMTKSLVRL